MDQMGFSSRGTEDERHGGRFEGNRSFAREDVCVGVSRLEKRKRLILVCMGGGRVTDRGVGVPNHFVSFKDEHIQQGGLAVV